MILHNKYTYGQFLKKLIKEKNKTQVAFYNELGIHKAYFYDIVSGKVNPPPFQIQLKIIRILNLQKEERETLLDLAAITRNELPGDILIYFKNSPELIKNIRQREDYINNLGGIINAKKEN